MNILFLNQKGGVGKSTVCILLGAALDAAGYRVAFRDTDPQGSVRFWARNIGKIALVDEIEDPEVILTDTPGRLDLQHSEKLGDLRQLIEQADKIIIVCEKSPFSIQATKPMCAFVNSAMRDHSKASILFNKVRSSTRIGKLDGGELADGLGIQPLQNHVPLAAPFENIQMAGFSAVNGRYRETLLKLSLEILK